MQKNLPDLLKDLDFKLTRDTLLFALGILGTLLLASILTVFIAYTAFLALQFHPIAGVAYPIILFVIILTYANITDKKG